MKEIVILFIFYLFAFHAYAQNRGTVTGTVLNENRDPVAFATVYVVNSQKALSCDERGRFVITVLPEEELGVRISAVGYRTQSWSLDAKGNLQRTFILTREKVVLEEVVVQGDNKNLEKTKSSQNTVKVDKAYLEENFSGSLMQSLEGIPGVKAMNIGSGQSKPAIRGLGFNRMVVAENGIKHEGQQWGEDHGLEIDQFAIDHVEIIKGPGSLLYGSDAIGGVVSLRSDDVPVKPIEGRFNLFARSNNESVGFSARLSGWKGQFYYKANLTLIDYADYKVPADSIQYYSYYIKLKDRRLRNTAGKEQDAGFTVGYLADKFQTAFQWSNVHAETGFFADAHGLEVRLSEIDYDKSSRDIDLPFHSVNHLKVANHSAWQTGRVRWEGNFSFQNNLRKEFAEPVSHGYMPVPPGTLERKFNKNTYSAQLGLKFLWAEKHSLVAGINAEHQRNRRAGWGFMIPDFEMTSFGVYVFDRYYLSEQWVLNAGIRFDGIKTHIHRYRDWYKTPVGEGDTVFHERSADRIRRFNSLTWSVGINYHAGFWNLKVNAGKSFRAPIPKELGSDGVNYHIFRYEKGEPGLSPEESYQFDAGINWQNAFLNIQVDPYLNYFPNYIYLNPTSAYYEGLQVYYYTQTEVVRYGFEAGLTGRVSRNFDATIQGDYLYAEQLSGDKKGYTLPFSPPWSARAGITYRPHTRWSGADGFLSFTYKIVGNQNKIVPPESKTPGYQTLDLSAGRVFAWKNYKIKVHLQGQNLFNRKFYDHTSYYRLIDVPEPGRNFSIRIGFEF